MNKATAKLLSKDEQSLVRATQPARLKKLSEEKLLALHTRVRRARNKYSKNYRRQGAAQVKADRSRGIAGKKNLRTAQKAEVFETALGRVSDALAAASHQSAAAIKKERLAAADKAKKAAARKAATRKRAAAAKKRAAAAKAAGKKKATAGKGTKGRGKADLKSPVAKKNRASSKASGQRRQAKRDKR